MHPQVIPAVWKQCASRPMCIFLAGRILFIYRKKSAKKDNKNNIKQNETKENYVQRTTIYNSNIGNQQINSTQATQRIYCCVNLFSTNILYMEHHFHELTIAQ